ncbi:MAG: FlgD immunoglobulin-like domain containing protein, partial [Candidatus Poribacteria bacterium]
VTPLRNENTFIFSNPLPLGKQGFYLQYTDADQRKPSCAVHIIHPGYAEFVPQGWIEHTTDPNADNVGAWINWENAKLSYEAGEEIGRFVYYLDVGGNNISPSNQDAGTVELGSSGPPNWSYRLTWNSGAVSEWTYIGSGITGASVSGSAADAGWATLKITATEVTFIGGSPLTTAGTLDGFVIEGTQQGMGRWKCHANEGSVDGPLPVNLSEFSATWQQDAILIRWRTAVEIGNAGWNIYRGSHREGPFQRINPKMIRADGRTIAREYEWKDSEVRKGQSYFYYLESVDFSGNSERSKVISAEEAVSEKRPQPVLMLKPVPPSRTEALAPYPNPLNPEVWLPYRLAEPAEVTILIYDVNGRLVRSWKLGRQPAGDYIDKKRALYWDGRNQFGERLPNGVYIYQFKAGSYTATKKLVILK